MFWRVYLGRISELKYDCYVGFSPVWMGLNKNRSLEQRYAEGPQCDDMKGK